MTDSISVDYDTGSGTDFCHERTYSITSVINSATTPIPSSDLIIQANGQITLQVASRDFEGTHTATVRIEGPGTTFIENNFEITIKPCVITGFT